MIILATIRQTMTEALLKQLPLKAMTRTQKYNPKLLNHLMKN